MQKDRATQPKSYAFLLREGTLIHRDFLDYSLLLLHTQCNEALRSPTPLTAQRSTPFFKGLRMEVKNVVHEDEDLEDQEEE